MGYILTDTANSTIYEFSLGSPAFEEYLQKYLQAKKVDMNKIKDKIKYVQKGVHHGYTLDDFKTINYFTQDKSINIEIDKPILSETLPKENNVVYGVPNYYEKIISGVPFYKNEGTMPACGPVSGMNIIGYYDNNGYPNLVTTQSLQNIYDQLYNLMNSFSVGGGQHATLPFNYGPGLDSYFTNVAHYNLSVTSDGYVTLSDYDSFVKYEISRNRPATILYHDTSNDPYDEEYGMHYVTLVGYGYETDSYGAVTNRYYIIHDLWNSYNVYRNWNSDLLYDIWHTFTVVPSL